MCTTYLYKFIQNLYKFISIYTHLHKFLHIFLNFYKNVPQVVHFSQKSFLETHKSCEQEEACLLVVKQLLKIESSVARYSSQQPYAVTYLLFAVAHSKMT